MLTLCKIDGISFDDLVTAIGETYNVIEGQNSGIALHHQREIRDIIGIKTGHSITFSGDNNPAKFDELKDYLFSTIRPSVELEVIHNQRTIKYEAAYNTGTRNVAHIDEADEDNPAVYWNELTVEFRPMENQINPEE